MRRMDTYTINAGADKIPAAVTFIHLEGIFFIIDLYVASLFCVISRMSSFDTPIEKLLAIAALT